MLSLILQWALHGCSIIGMRKLYIAAFQVSEMYIPFKLAVKIGGACNPVQIISSKFTKKSD